MFLQYWSIFFNSNTASYTLTVRNKNVWRKKERPETNEAVFPTTNNFFDVAGSRSSSSSSNINISSSHVGAEDDSQTFAHLRQ